MGGATNDADAVVTLAHGGGGRRQRELIEEIVRPRLSNAWLDPLDDAARLALDGARLAFTADAFAVDPIFFPGGDIGSLAVNGTVNDLAVSGARPRFLSLTMVLEEGVPLATLGAVLDSVAAAARRAEVFVVCGDTKVVERGRAGGGMFLSTSGIGELLDAPPTGATTCRAGDELVVSGPIGDHGAAIFAAREELGGMGGVQSDCAPVSALAAAACDGFGVRFMRDPTRGGLLAIAHELAGSCGLTVELDDARIPVRPETRGLADVLGLEAWRLACEGRVVAVVPEGRGEGLAARWAAMEDGRGAAACGRLAPRRPSAPVVLRAATGVLRPLDFPADDPLPRIC